MKPLQPLFLLLVFCLNVQAQDTLVFYKSVQKPSVLSGHTFGIFNARLEGHFKSTADRNKSLHFDYLSANVWGQPVDNFIPISNELRDEASSRVWHIREFAFDRNDVDFQSNTENYKIAYDGVIKGLKASLYVPLNTKNALQIELRSFILTRGRFPFTGITGDDFIESVHSNIAGGEDPFQRRDFRLNEAEIDYTDRQGRRMQIYANDAFFGGVKFDFYHYFDELLPYGIHFNVGLHSGVNASPYNKSIDLGLSANAFRNFAFSDNKYFQLGLSLGYLNLNTVSLSDHNIEFATRPSFLNLESVFTYNLINTKEQTHTFGIDFYIQSSYNDP